MGFSLHPDCPASGVRDLQRGDDGARIEIRRPSIRCRKPLSHQAAQRCDCEAVGLHDRFHASAQRGGQHAKCLPLFFGELHVLGARCSDIVIQAVKGASRQSSHNQPVQRRPASRSALCRSEVSWVHQTLRHLQMQRKSWGSVAQALGALGCPYRGSIASPPITDRPVAVIFATNIFWRPAVSIRPVSKDVRPRRCPHDQRADAVASLRAPAAAPREKSHQSFPSEAATTTAAFDKRRVW
jgi:hypothetical protein